MKILIAALALVTTSAIAACDCDFDPLCPGCPPAIDSSLGRHLFVVRGLPFPGSVGARQNPNPSMWIARGPDGHVHSLMPWTANHIVCTNDLVMSIWPWLSAAVWNTSTYRCFQIIDADRGTNGVVTTNWVRYAASGTNSNVQIFALTNLWNPSFVDADLRPLDEAWFYLQPGQYWTNGSNVYFTPPTTNAIVGPTNQWPSDVNLLTNDCWWCFISPGPVIYTNSLVKTNQSFIDPTQRTNITGPRLNRFQSLLSDARLPKLQLAGSSVLVAGVEFSRYSVETTVSLEGPWTNLVPVLDLGESGTNSFAIDRTEGVRFYRLKFSP